MRAPVQNCVGRSPALAPQVAAQPLGEFIIAMRLRSERQPSLPAGQRGGAAKAARITNWRWPRRRLLAALRALRRRLGTALDDSANRASADHQHGAVGNFTTDLRRATTSDHLCRRVDHFRNVEKIPASGAVN